MTRTATPDWATPPAPQALPPGSAVRCSRDAITCTIPSMTIPGICYALQITPATARCTCPHFMYRHEECKHITRAREVFLCGWSSQDGTPQSTPSQCPDCGADTITTT